MFNEYPPFITIAECCEILSVERHSVYKLIEEGKIQALRTNDKIWRIPRNSLAKYCLSESGILVDEEEINDYI